MPRTKKRRSKTKNDLQFNRTIKRNGKWRGKSSPISYKRKKRETKRVFDKIIGKIEYQPKFKDDEDFFAPQTIKNYYLILNKN